MKQRDTNIDNKLQMIGNDIYSVSPAEYWGLFGINIMQLMTIAEVTFHAQKGVLGHPIA